MTWNLRDTPEDEPASCDTLDEARERARHRAAAFGHPVLIYERSAFDGESLVEEIQ